MCLFSRHPPIFSEGKDRIKLLQFSPRQVGAKLKPSEFHHLILLSQCHQIVCSLCLFLNICLKSVEHFFHNRFRDYRCSEIYFKLTWTLPSNCFRIASFPSIMRHHPSTKTARQDFLLNDDGPDQYHRYALEWIPGNYANPPQFQSQFQIFPMWKSPQWPFWHLDISKCYERQFSNLLVHC